VIRSSFPTMQASAGTPCSRSTRDSQHSGNAMRNITEVGIADLAYQICQSTFVDTADLLRPCLRSDSRRRDVDNQRKMNRFGRAGQWHDDYGIAPAVDFVGGKDDAGASLGYFRATHRVKRYPIHLTTLNACVHFRGLVVGWFARNFACAMANSRSNDSWSKSGSQSSTDPVKSASSHSWVSARSSGCAASIAFMASQAATSSASSFSNSRRTKSTRNWLRCLGGTARASLAATSSGKRSSTCLGESV
jgi:hypothetical protein